MNEQQSLALAASGLAVEASSALIEFARNEADKPDIETAMRLCDAAKVAFDAIGIEERDDEAWQVYAALVKFLEGWVG